MSDTPDRTFTVSADEAAPVAKRFEEGTTLGDFVVGRLLGEGGMGTVYEAYDPTLERTVAIKVLRNQGGDANASRRLLREAQAMARLAHPNVATIHEVGSADELVFLVMEHVDGETLGEWLRRGHPWKEIVEVISQAGRGLQAAHEVGLVHRDFKPGNVLIGGDGRVLVTDFGIAQGSCNPKPTRSGRAISGAQPSAGVSGTPGYMAPEQARGESVDARADQFAFGVTLRDALFGRDARDSSGERTQAATNSSTLPKALRPVIERMTDETPNARYADMEAALAALRQLTRPRHRVLLLAIALLAIGVGGGVAAILSRGPAPKSACEQSADLVDQTWNASTAKNIRVAFESTSRGHAGKTAERVSRLVDDFAASWRLGRKSACSADPASRTQRLRCLDLQLDEVRAQLAVWGRADDTVVDAAVRTASALPKTGQCTAPPPAPSKSARPLLEKVNRAKALQASGKLQDAQAIVDTLLDDSANFSDPSVAAAIYHVAADVAVLAGDAPTARERFAQAARYAATAGDDHQMADALLGQAMATVDNGRGRDALGIIDAAETLVLRAKLPDLDASISGARGAAFAAIGDGEAALPHLMRALELSRGAAEGDVGGGLDVAANLGRLSTAYIGLGRYQDSIDALVECVDIETRLLGPAHPDVASSYHDLAVSESRLDQHEQALAHYQLARDIFIETYGPRHVNVGLVQLSMGTLARLMGDAALARASYDGAEPILRERLGENHPHFAALYGGRAAIADEEDRCGDAIDDYTHALDVLVASEVHGQRLARAQTSLSICLMDVGRIDEGYQLLVKALDELNSPEIPAHVKATTNAAMAQAQWERGNVQKGREHAQRALDSLDAPGVVDESQWEPLRQHLREELKSHASAKNR